VLDRSSSRSAADWEASIAAELTKRVLFREVNAHIREMTARLWAEVASYEVLCECGGKRCVQSVEVPATVYDDVHGDDGRYLVARGHVGAPRDRIVATAPTYRIVAA
jgi:hypothetical protein